MSRKIIGLLLIFVARIGAAHDLIFSSPVDPGDINQSCRRFGTGIYDQDGDWVRHAGRDYCAAQGAPVYAAGAGVVMFAASGNNHGFGSTIILKHALDQGSSSGNSIYTLYAHLSAIAVKEDQWVTAGQPIGSVGHTGSGSNGIDHLHFEVKIANLLEAPDPDNLSSGAEYGYTASPPDQMGYVNPELFLYNDNWRRIHVHEVEAVPRSGRSYVEGRFSNAGEVTADASLLDGVVWTQSRIDFNIFQNGLALETFDYPRSILLSPGDDSRFEAFSYPFQDVEPRHWYAGPAATAWARGVVVGESGLLVPARNASFSEFFKMLVEASPGLQPVACNEGERPVSAFSLAEFPAFSAGNPWYCGYYKALVQAGWITEFISVAGQRGRPAQSIQREEVAFFLARALPPGEGREEVDFSDVEEEHQFYDEIRECAARGIFQGYQDGSFGSGLNIIRAEIVKVLEQTFYPRERHGN